MFLISQWSCAKLLYLTILSNWGTVVTFPAQDCSVEDKYFVKVPKPDLDQCNNSFGATPVAFAERGTLHHKSNSQGFSPESFVQVALLHSHPLIATLVFWWKRRSLQGLKNHSPVLRVLRALICLLALLQIQLAFWEDLERSDVETSTYDLSRCLALWMLWGCYFLPRWGLILLIYRNMSAHETEVGQRWSCFNDGRYERVFKEGKTTSVTGWAWFHFLLNETVLNVRGNNQCSDATSASRWSWAWGVQQREKRVSVSHKLCVSSRSWSYSRKSICHFVDCIIILEHEIHFWRADFSQRSWFMLSNNMTGEHMRHDMSE